MPLTSVLSTLPALARRARPTPSPSPSPVPTPVSPPTPHGELVRFDRLRRDIATLSANAPGRLGITVVDVTHYARFTARADEPFALAGVAHYAIALAAFRRADQHKLNLDERIELHRGDLRRDPSPIADSHPHGGVSYTYAELLSAMLVHGDTTASDAVLAAVGGTGGVSSFLSHLNKNGFDFRKSEADIAADAKAHRILTTGGDNSGTPNAVANLLLGLTNQEYLRLDGTNELLQLLTESQTDPEFFRAGFPTGADLAHASGTSDTFDGTTDATNDAGILTVPGGRRVVVVAFLAESRADFATRAATLANVARTVYQAYTL